MNEIFDENDLKTSLMLFLETKNEINLEKIENIIEYLNNINIIKEIEKIIKIRDSIKKNNVENYYKLILNFIENYFALLTGNLIDFINNNLNFDEIKIFKDFIEKFFKNCNLCEIYIKKNINEFKDDLINKIN